MATPAERQPVKPEDLELPPPRPIPRPGDRVVWYENGMPKKGTLLGSTLAGRALIEKEENGFRIDQPFASIRDADRDEQGEHGTHGQPVWMSLAEDAIICRPTEAEGKKLDQLIGNRIQPGNEKHATHAELAREIWIRGFEVFFTGKPLREALTRAPGKDADLITTMPRNWIRILLDGMYGTERVKEETPQPWSGLFTIGNTVGSVNAFSYVRFFRWTFEDEVYLHGASFKDEGSFTDFTFNAIYYDFKNKVLIDPTGHGLDDAYSCCLRPMDWSGQLPEPDKMAIGFEILRYSLLGYTLCAEREAELLTAVSEAVQVDEDDLCGPLAKALDGLGLPLNDVLNRIGEFFVVHGLADLFQYNVQPAIKKIMDDGGSS
jgi:hypothetical protein